MSEPLNLSLQEAKTQTDIAPSDERDQTMIRGLRTVLALANELMSCPDVDTTLRQAVEAARNVLGLERCGIFFERDGYMEGTYGTDAHGQTTDEHGLRLSTDDTWRQRVAHLRPHEAQWIIMDDNTHTEWDGRQRVAVGEGWVVCSYIPFSDGSRAFLFNDTTISNTPLNETQQEIVAVFCSLLGKIIERKQVEVGIRKALEKETELSDMKSRIIATISHEFRTPLAVIQSASESLDFYLDRMNEEKRRERIIKIQTQVRRMTALMENVLTISKAQTLGMPYHPQPVDVVVLCQTLVNEIALTSGQKHEILFFAENNRSSYILDENLLRLILTNLLTNAVKYSPSGSSIQLQLTCEADQVVFRVQDQGIGIPEDDQKYLFQDFYRAKNVGAVSGTGLGLGIVKRAVETHKGTIEVESRMGIGTTFTVRIPTA